MIAQFLLNKFGWYKKTKKMNEVLSGIADEHNSRITHIFFPPQKARPEVNPIKLRDERQGSYIHHPRAGFSSYQWWTYNITHIG